VTEFEFDNVRTSNAISRYEIQRILVLRLISYAQRAKERRQACFLFSNQAITQTTVIECAT